MPAVLTHKSIMLLARRRVRQIRDALDQKVAHGRNVTDLDRSVLALARECERIFTSSPQADGGGEDEAFDRRLALGVSKFAVMGSMGPDIPAFSTVFKPGQGWAFDTVHKGTPDSNREVVAAGTSELIFAFWRAASRELDATTVIGAGRKPVVRDALKAYVLGHLCHVAGDVISHPYVNGVEWRLGHGSRPHFSHEATESSMDARIARKVLLAAGMRQGAPDWDVWWPTNDDLSEFFPVFARAFAEAFREVYVKDGRRRTGFREFEKELEELEPPAADAAFFADGYGLYRRGIVGKVYTYGAFSWFLILLLVVGLPLLLFPPLAAALPHASPWLEGQDGADGERAQFEVLSLALFLGAVESLGVSSVAAAHSTKHAEVRSGLGLTSALVNVFFGFGFLATMADERLSGTVRWPLLFGAPTAISTSWLVAALTDLFRAGRRIRGGLSVLFALPIGFLVLCGIFHLILILVRRGTEDVSLKSGGFWVTYGLWAALILALLIWLAHVVRDIRIPEKPEAFAADAPHLVRLFDDTTLFADSTFPGPEVARVFPAGRRELAKLWWDGPGQMFVRPDRHRLVFRFTTDDAAGEQVVPGPIAPMTLGELLRRLEREVKDPGGQAGHLKAAVVHPADPDLELPPGAAFAHHGDGLKKKERKKNEDRKHKEAAASFKQLGTGEQDTDYILHHAPKPAQAIRFGRRGPVLDLRWRPDPDNPGAFLDSPAFDDTTLAREEKALGDLEAVDGYPYSHDPTTPGDGETLMDYAGDLGALLCLGATSQMSGGPAPLAPVHQVFRNWSLDRRRVNEWRMLVAGNAFSEKGTAPDRADPSMLRPVDPAQWQAPLARADLGGSADAVREGERTARELGWTRLLRAWLNMTSRPDVDPLSEEALDPNNPANRALSRGMAYLLDRPDPKV